MRATDDELTAELRRLLRALPDEKPAARKLPAWFTAEVEESYIAAGVIEAAIYVREGYTQANLDAVVASRAAKARGRATAKAKRDAQDMHDPLGAALRRARDHMRSAKSKAGRARARVERAELDAKSSDFMVSTRAQMKLPELREWLEQNEATLARVDGEVARLEATAREAATGGDTSS
jgi:hypothetical protein